MEFHHLNLFKSHFLRNRIIYGTCIGIFLLNFYTDIMVKIIVNFCFCAVFLVIFVRKFCSGAWKILIILGQKKSYYEKKETS